MDDSQRELENLRAFRDQTIAREQARKANRGARIGAWIEAVVGVFLIGGLVLSLAAIPIALIMIIW